jgi:hypothetical protein
MITPRMVRIDGVKTPPKVPNFFDLFIGFFGLTGIFIVTIAG